MEVRMGLTRSVRRAATGLAAAGLIAGMVLMAPSAALAAPAASDTQLAYATVDLENSAQVAGTAWSTDPVSRKVVVTVDSTVTGAKLQQVMAVAKRNSTAVTVERISGTLTPLVSGGDAIYNAGGRCSLGFNVRSGNTFYLLTAGHCTNLGGNWYTNSSRTTLIGPTANSSFPGNDYGRVRYSNTSLTHPGTVQAGSRTLTVTSAANPSVGQAACRDGSTTGTQCGQVTGLNATVNYGGGNIVRGLIRTNICADRGDSGGSFYSNPGSGSSVTAYGLTSGGNLDCGGSPVTFFQPVVEAMQAYGVSLV
jgi:streptogrisin B